MKRTRMTKPYLDKVDEKQSLGNVSDPVALRTLLVLVRSWNIYIKSIGDRSRQLAWRKGSKNAASECDQYLERSWLRNPKHRMEVVNDRPGAMQESCWEGRLLEPT